MWRNTPIMLSNDTEQNGCGKFSHRINHMSYFRNLSANFVPHTDSFITKAQVRIKPEIRSFLLL